MPLSSCHAARIFDVSQRVALVTGAASGLGQAIARVLLDNGARVVMGDKHAVAPCGNDRRSLAVECDVTDDAAITGMFDQAEQQFGLVDVVFNVAGIGLRESAAETSRDHWRTIMRVNGESAFCVSREAGRRLIAARHSGSIVNVTSFLRERPMRNVAAYGASKAAMHQMTRSLAFEWARHGIRVNEIAPGWFPTGMTAPFLEGRAGSVVAQANPMRRLGSPDDLAGVVLLLASDASAYITGASIAVDGGQHLD
ncbi:SDR family NAD(P)-dependent oxidoreductase [Pararhizobium haloflavum]|uniref:SDR family NAD(P)-dependent oxidoreductase n=1 Tax=Pararhizobium haloflavum TaxID=2037914 RepID=UPI000C17843E|nr:SDR family oxidoreductase [Pararhizobium haloflavum]